MFSITSQILISVVSFLSTSGAGLLGFWLLALCGRRHTAYRRRVVIEVSGSDTAEAGRAPDAPEVHPVPGQALLDAPLLDAPPHPEAQEPEGEVSVDSPPRRPYSVAPSVPLARLVDVGVSVTAATTTAGTSTSAPLLIDSGSNIRLIGGELGGTTVSVQTIVGTRTVSTQARDIELVFHWRRFFLKSRRHSFLRRVKRCIGDHLDERYNHE